MAKRGKRVARTSTPKRGNAVRKKVAKRAAAAAKTKKSSKKIGKKRSLRSTVTKARKKKQNSTPTLTTETTDIGVTSEPASTALVSEIEATRIPLPDSDDANQSQGFTPPPERSAA